MSRKEFLRRCRRSKLFVVGFSIVFIIVLAAVLSPLIAPYDPKTSNLPMKFAVPNLFNGWSGYPLGGDALGRDMLSRLLVGARYSLAISVSAVLIASAIGSVLGMIAGYFGGWLDTIIMRLGDMQLSIPEMLLAIAISAVLGPKVSNLVIVLVITGWVQYARVIRTTVSAIRERDFIAAAVVEAKSNMGIIFSEILPNTFNALLIIMSEQIGQKILVETALSFLGLGVQPPTPSWGLMISEGRNYIALYPWVVMVPGVALMITVIGFSFLGDGLRDVLDPKMRDA